MKYLKLLAVIVAFAVVALLPTTSNAATPTVSIAGAGSTAVYQATLDDATGLSICGANHWTKASGGVMHDNRSGLNGNPAIQDEVNNVWITWDGASDGSTATVTCFYLAVDSGIGVRGYMANPRATIFLNGAGLSGSAGDNLSILGGDAPLPANVFGAYGSATPGTVVLNIAFSDVRPEDAQFQVARLLSKSAAGSTTGLGYGNWANPYSGAGDANAGACPFFTCVGSATIQSSFKTGEQTLPVMFRLSTLSTDPISGNAIVSWTTYPVGAVPILPIVSNQDCSNTGLGNGLSPCTNNVAGPWVAGPYAAHNLNRFTAGYLFDGTLTRTTDVIETSDTVAQTSCTAKSYRPGATGANDCALAQLQREVPSGTYTTWEFSIVRSHAVQNSQEDNVGAVPPGPPPQPLNVQGANGSQRYRVIGTGEMVKAVCGPLAAPQGCAKPPIVNGGAVEANRLGYAFWSYGNLKPLAGSHNGGVGVNYAAGGAAPLGHYLTLDGVDGLFNQSTDNPDGALNPPICTSLPCPPIPFTHLIDGSYSAWNIVRAIVPGNTAIGDGSPQDKLIGGLAATAAKYSDFLLVNKMHVFRSHRAPNVVGFGVFNGNGCPAPAGIQNYDGELGQDAGGAIFNIQSDLNYLQDTVAATSDCKGIGPVNQGLINQQQ